MQHVGMTGRTAGLTCVEVAASVARDLGYEDKSGRRTDMISKFALTTLLALAICGPVQEAAAQDAVGGAIVGGVLGGVVGGALGGGGGAAVRRDRRRRDLALRLRRQGEPRPGGYRYYKNGCAAWSSPDGSWSPFSPRYCGVQAQYAPPPPRPRYYDDTPRCMRSPTYNPRRGTFIGRDGYERPCP